MSALELEGYLTGVLVTPSLIPPSRWMAGLWGNEKPVFADAEQIQSVLGAVTGLYNALSQRMEPSLRRLEVERSCDYRPAFQPDAGKPSRDAVTTWVRGIWRAMSLARSTGRWCSTTNAPRFWCSRWSGSSSLSRTRCSNPRRTSTNGSTRAPPTSPDRSCCCAKSRNSVRARPCARLRRGRSKLVATSRALAGPGKSSSAAAACSDPPTPDQRVGDTPLTDRPQEQTQDEVGIITQTRQAALGPQWPDTRARAEEPSGRSAA
jgi:hypothetical protein